VVSAWTQGGLAGLLTLGLEMEDSTQSTSTSSPLSTLKPHCCQHAESVSLFRIPCVARRSSLPEIRPCLHGASISTYCVAVPQKTALYKTWPIKMAIAFDLIIRLVTSLDCLKFLESNQVVRILSRQSKVTINNCSPSWWSFDCKITL
jgi:hypothetical protein